MLRGMAPIIRQLQEVSIQASILSRRRRALVIPIDILIGRLTGQLGPRLLGTVLKRSARSADTVELNASRIHWI